MRHARIGTGKMLFLKSSAIRPDIGFIQLLIAIWAKLQSTLASTTIEPILKSGLHEFIDIFQFNLNVVDQAIYQSFFDRRA